MEELIELIAGVQEDLSKAYYGHVTLRSVDYDPSWESLEHALVELRAIRDRL